MSAAGLVAELKAIDVYVNEQLQIEGVDKTRLRAAQVTAFVTKLQRVSVATADASQLTAAVRSSTGFSEDNKKAMATAIDLRLQSGNADDKDKRLQSANLLNYFTCAEWAKLMSESTSVLSKVHLVVERMLCINLLHPSEQSLRSAAAFVVATNKKAMEANEKHEVVIELKKQLHARRKHATANLGIVVYPGLPDELNPDFVKTAYPTDPPVQGALQGLADITASIPLRKTNAAVAHRPQPLQLELGSARQQNPAMMMMGMMQQMMQQMLQMNQPKPPFQMQIHEATPMGKQLELMNGQEKSSPEQTPSKQLSIQDEHAKSPETPLVSTPVPTKGGLIKVPEPLHDEGDDADVSKSGPETLTASLRQPKPLDEVCSALALAMAERKKSREGAKSQGDAAKGKDKEKSAAAKTKAQGSAARPKAEAKAKAKEQAKAKGKGKAEAGASKKTNQKAADVSNKKAKKTEYIYADDRTPAPVGTAAHPPAPHIYNGGKVYTSWTTGAYRVLKTVGDRVDVAVKWGDNRAEAWKKAKALIDAERRAERKRK
jgi:hypothetical protein